MTNITGHVHNPDANGPSCAILVELLNPTNPRARLYSAEVDQSGKYDMPGIDSGSYLLFCAIWGCESRYYWEIPVTVRQEKSINIDLLADTAQTLK
jgi:hypothetical protein